ncbi:MAG: hypothetical protein QG608_2908 [Actinomycetota bacterium]|nr:hypothetical protein [Actinomycetota bacterium]
MYLGGHGLRRVVGALAPAPTRRSAFADVRPHGQGRAVPCGRNRVRRQAILGEEPSSVWSRWTGKAKVQRAE